MTIGTQHIGSGGGLTPTGNWVDVRTGNVRTVKTMVDDMSGNGATIMFTDGDVIPFSEFSMYYIQESDADEVDTETTVNTSSKPTLNRDLLMRGLEPKDEGEETYNTPQRTIKQKNERIEIATKSEISKQKQLLIDLFNKTEEYPTIDAENILIKNIPTDALKTLHDYFDVTVDDIADILMEKCIDKSALRQSVVNNIVSMMNIGDNNINSILSN